MADLPADVQLHQPSRDDVEVFVPVKRQYGVVQAGGKQVIYASREVNGGRFLIDVHPDHLTRVLRAIEGSKLAQELRRGLDAAAPDRHPARVDRQPQSRPSRSPKNPT